MKMEIFKFNPGSNGDGLVGEIEFLEIEFPDEEMLQKAVDYIELKEEPWEEYYFYSSAMHETSTSYLGRYIRGYHNKPQWKSNSLYWFKSNVFNKTQMYPDTPF